MATLKTRKSLRIGVIQSGTIIEERLFATPQRITIGKHHRNTFSVFAPEIPQSHPLFEVNRGRYQLNYTDRMAGRISLGGTVHKLARLKEEGKAVAHGSSGSLRHPNRLMAVLYQILDVFSRSRVQPRPEPLMSVPIDDQARGKVEIGDFIFLFQFVTPPPVRPDPQMPVALRGGPLRFLNNIVELSGTFGLSLLLSTLIQVGFILYLVVEVPPPPRPVDINDLPDEIRMILAKPEQLMDNEPEELVDESESRSAEEELQEQLEEQTAEVEEERSEERAREVAQDTAPPEPMTREDRLRVARERVREEAFFSAMYTTGEGGGPVMEQVFNMSDRRVEHVLRRVQARGDSSLVSRSGALSTDGAEEGIPLARAVDVDISASTGATEERARSIEATEDRDRVRVRANVRGSRERVVGEGRCDPEELNQSLRQKVRDIQRCYERVLPDNPNLEGRIVLQFTIDEVGRVSDIRLVENEVGDQVGSCIEGRVRRWRFDACEGGAVTVQKTFILSPARD